MKGWRSSNSYGKRGKSLKHGFCLWRGIWVDFLSLLKFQGIAKETENQRARRLKKIKISLRDCNFQAGMKPSSENENCKRAISFWGFSRGRDCNLEAGIGPEKLWQAETWQDSAHFLRPEIGEFSPHFGAISLLSPIENLEKKKNPLEKFQKIQWRKFRRRANSEVQTVNWECGREGAVERGVKSSLKKVHKPWIRGKKGA